MSAISADPLWNERRRPQTECPSTPGHQPQSPVDVEKTGPQSPLPLTDAAGRAEHLPALDGVRGTAILLVLSLHFFAGVPSPGIGNAVRRIASSGWIGVDLFFVLSGFLITNILLRTKHERRYFRNFYMRRTLRIFPLYYGVLFVSFVVLPLTSAGEHMHIGDFTRTQGWLWSYCSNVLLSMRNDWMVLSIRHMTFGHFWSLAIEEHFYLIWPAVVLFVSTRTLLKVCLGGIALAVAFRLALYGDPRWTVAACIFTPCRIDAPLAGAALAVAMNLKVANIQRWCLIIGTSCACYMAGVILRDGSLYATAPKIQTIGLTLVAGLFASMLGYLLHSRYLQRLMSARALCFFGTYSYGLYVFHWLLFPTFQGSLNPEGSLGGALRVSAVVLSISICASVASYHVYERPFLRLKRLFE